MNNKVTRNITCVTLIFWLFLGLIFGSSSNDSFYVTFHDDFSGTSISKLNIEWEYYRTSENMLTLEDSHLEHVFAHPSNPNQNLGWTSIKKYVNTTLLNTIELQIMWNTVIDGTISISGYNTENGFNAWWIQFSDESNDTDTTGYLELMMKNVTHNGYVAYYNSDYNGIPQMGSSNIVIQSVNNRQGSHLIFKINGDVRYVIEGCDVGKWDRLSIAMIVRHSSGYGDGTYLRVDNYTESHLTSFENDDPKTCPVLVSSIPGYEKETSSNLTVVANSGFIIFGLITILLFKTVYKKEIMNYV